MTIVNFWLFTVLVFCHLVSFTYTLKKEDCEVCITVVERFMGTLTKEMKENQKSIEDEFKNFCSTVDDSKEERFCYYIGGKEDSATGILGELSWPVKASMPPEVVCMKLNKKDTQLCSLRYEKEIDLSVVDLKKLKVRDLKKILSKWNEDCDGCLEKTDYIKRIEELKSKHVKEEL